MLGRWIEGMNGCQWKIRIVATYKRRRYSMVWNLCNSFSWIEVVDSVECQISHTCEVGIHLTAIRTNEIYCMGPIWAFLTYYRYEHANV